MKRNIFIILILFVCQYASAQTVTIGEATLHFNDILRKRPLVTEVWYPTIDAINQQDKQESPFVRIKTVRNGNISNAKYPLVLISHGTGGDRLSLEWLADALVESGFMVAAVDHWGNTYNNKIAIDFVTPWERPQDISFVLTGLLKDSKFGPAIDQERIGAAGFSIGGYTVIGLAGGVLDYEALKQYSFTPKGQQEINIPEFPGLINIIKSGEADKSYAQSPKHLKDKRIKAFFAMCPAIGQGFVSKSQFNDLDKPLYILEVESDSITPYKTNAEHYSALIPSSKYLLIKGKANHYVFLNEANEVLKKEAPIIFVDDPSVDRHAIHQRAGELAVQFFQKALK